MPELQSALYQGQVMHHRFRPTKHRFVYNVFSLCLDLDELSKVDQNRLFSINRFNLFSFHEKDHGNGKGNLASDIRKLLVDRGYHSATGRIELLCYPRIMGYTFNPLSVFFCYNKQNQLEVVLYEVSNTFGSRHTYLLPANNNVSIVRHGCHKLMYVSPFMPMDTFYQFRISPPTQKVAVCIRQSEQAEGATDPEAKADANKQPILHAVFTGDRIALNDRTLVRMFFSYPLMTLKVMGAIHWEALKLWRKKLKLQPRDKVISHSISWQDQHGVSHHESL